MTPGIETYDLSQLEKSSAKWRSSPALRAVYVDIYKAMRRSLIPGRVLEVGSGIGVAGGFFENLITSDVRATGFVDRVVSAYDIPAESWANIIALDVLHHLQEPLRFFASAAGALVPGGRLVLAEPAGTAFGRQFYRLCHHEPCKPGKIVPPFRFATDDAGGFANMGMAHALFGKQRPALEVILRSFGMRILVVHYRDLVAYPATGGFSRPALLPAPVLRAVLAVERLLPQRLMRLMALRMIVVLEKGTLA